MMLDFTCGRISPKCTLSLILHFSFLILPSPSHACTGLYAGKGVTEDGIAYVARTVDAGPWTSGHRIEIRPRVENVAGRQYCALLSGVTWELPATTWKCVSTPRMTAHGRGRMDSACVNEKGLALTGTTTAHVNDKVLAVDPYVTTGFGEESMPGLLGICAATAKEAVELMGRAIAEKGHFGTEIYMFVDRNEAWYAEVYTGHQWAAVRMPDDAVAVYGNMLMLREFDPDSPEVLHSPDLVAVAEKAGTLVRTAGGKIDLFKSYSTPIGAYSNYRTWFGHRMLAPETAGKYVDSVPGPLFYKPAKKVTRRDLFEVMRTRYEGVNCPEETGCKTIRTIGTTKQATCHLLEVRPDLPEAMQATAWVTFGNAEHVPFLPVNAAIDRVELPYSVNIRRGNWEIMDLRTASAHFRRLAALAEQDRINSGAGLREHWRKLEDRLIAEYPKVLKKSAEAYRRNPKSGIGLLTSESCRIQRDTLADAKDLLDKLLWYVTVNNRIQGDGSGATSKPDRPFVCWEPRARKTKVLFFVDADDLSDQETRAAICRFAGVLRSEGVRGHFVTAAEQGASTAGKGDKDVAEALKFHLADSHFADVGNRLYTSGEREVAWFDNVFRLPYCDDFDLESFLPPAGPLDLPRCLQALASREYAVLHMRPQTALARRDEAALAVYFDRLRAFVHALNADKRFEVTDREKLEKSFLKRKAITAAELPVIRAALLQRLGPISKPESWSVADVFQATVKLLRGDPSHVPGRVFGFHEPPHGVASPVEVSADDLKAAAKRLDLSTFIPSEIAVGDKMIGPADFLYAALEVLVDKSQSVTVKPCDQLGSVITLMPSLEGDDPTSRLRLKLWTLRYDW